MVENVRAQAIATDRPDFADATSTVAVGVLQVESGYSYNRNLDDKEHTLGEWMLRTGLSERAEMRIGVDSYKYDGGSGFGDGSLDFRFRLYQGKPGTGNRFIQSEPACRRHSSHRQPQVPLEPGPTGGHADFGCAIESSADRCARGELCAAQRQPGTVWRVFRRRLTGLQSSVERTFWYVETFGTTVEGPAEPTIASAGGGLLWLARENFQFDIHYLSALNGATPNYSIGVGVSFYTGLK